MDDPQGRRVGSWFWALSPLYTCGFATSPIMIWAAIRKRSGWQALAAFFYTAALVAMVAGLQDDSESASALYGMCLLVSWFGGAGHALAIRKWVFDLHGRPASVAFSGPPMAAPQPPPMPAQLGPPPAWRQLSPLQAQQQAALAAAMDQKHARDFARNLAANNLQLAYQLRIGQVDVPARAFPDGGLVDVNNASAAGVAVATGLPLEIAQRIESVSEQVNGFTSVEDLCAQTQLAPQTFDHLLDLLYFPPRLPG
jgi:DNA uptake protein ComE-like DNA-binding protein